MSLIRDSHLRAPRPTAALGFAKYNVNVTNAAIRRTVTPVPHGRCTLGGNRIQVAPHASTLQKRPLRMLVTMTFGA
ncbi:hypothetical protein [Pseudoxanthomonas sp. PXM04]|uniref:hypothetical protein n=1 Tax=Pseudoxanthomonas sp. PXM04 TaxID=2769297 RepID=UPI0017840C92|nr:hypothetical protein [Pseudoxanthomonas sp. PXM04]MBD9378172.1 hypothetical protein [Pseudoxanthomonas sp. PXM04]